MRKILAVAGGAVLLGLLSIRPYNKRKKQLRSLFKQKYIAHRGLFKEPDVPENSLAAFEEAVRQGYPIELDVQLSRDGKLVVFHDDTLKRMCHVQGRVRDKSLRELKSLRLAGTNEKIPEFKEVLEIVNGQVPLMVEVKPEGHFIQTVEKTMKQLGKYHGRYCIESFQPLVLLWLKRHHPEVLRGQLSTDYRKDGDRHNRIIQFVLSNMMCNFFTRPDFISYNHLYSDRPAFRICTKLYKSANAAWTIKSEKQLKDAENDFEFFIFDGFTPA